MWYSDRYPWGRNKWCYVIHVEPIANDSWRVVVNFETRKRYLRDSLGYPNDKIDAFKSFLAAFTKIRGSRDQRFSSIKRHRS